MLPNLETLSDVSSVSSWLKEMAIDFAGKQFSQMERKQRVPRFPYREKEVKSSVTEELKQRLIIDAPEKRAI